MIFTDFDGKMRCCLNKALLLVMLSDLHSTGFSLGFEPPFQPTTIPFLEPITYNITVFLGQTAYLPCVAKHLGDKTISWIRRKDLHILTYGNQVYTNDKRFSLLREGKLLNAWTLKISPVEKKDEGQYECALNTEPKMTAIMQLIVLGSSDDPGSRALALGMLDSPYNQKDDQRFSGGYQAKILGPSLVELEQGGIANFTCIISHGGTAPSPNITWFYNEIPIQNARVGYSTETQKSSFSTTSQLVILKINKKDEGKYCCGGVLIYPDCAVLKQSAPNQQTYHVHSLNSKLKEENSSASRFHHSMGVFLILFINMFISQ